jgi:UDP-3-O-[3-hydroxymyristoyl] glucosamine N-acyltransferase
MEFTASQIASFIDGKIIGDENALITGFHQLKMGKQDIFLL